jgi:hypothetical protein
VTAAAVRGGARAAGWASSPSLRLIGKRVLTAVPILSA